MNPNDPNQQHIANLIQQNDGQQQSQNNMWGTPPPPQQQPDPNQQQPGQFTEQPPQPQQPPAQQQQQQNNDQPPSWANGLVEKVESLEEQLGQVVQQPPQQQQPTQQQQQEGWRPRSFEDIDKRIEERAQEISTKQMEAWQEQQRQQAEAQEKARQEADKHIDGQLEELRQNNVLPPVQNQYDPNDPGRQAQTELIAYAVNQGTDNLVAAAQSLQAHHQSGYYFDRTKNGLVRRGSQTAAAQAPIAGASPSVTGGNAQQGPTMGDIATKSLDQLMAEGSQQVGIGAGQNVQF